MDRVFAILFSVSTLLCLVLGQIPIPKTRLGYVYNGGSNDAPISLDIHMGPLCPDSRDALPAAKQVATHYGPKTLRLTLHMFPLPYHHHSFYTAIGAKAVLKLSSVVSAYQYFDLVYNNLAMLSNDATVNMSTTQVLGLLAGFASQVGIERQQFLATMAMPELDSECRGAWKYSCSRAVFGTPTFFLNDVTVAADPTWTLDDWKQVIDPLLFPEEAVRDNKTCPAKTVRCEYLPKKIECCTPGENCIPNVGCRCWEKDCGEPEKTCPSGEEKCEYLPGKTECCTKGENCIPNVGCRCFTEDGKPCEELDQILGYKPQDTKPLV